MVGGVFRFCVLALSASCSDCHCSISLIIDVFMIDCHLRNNILFMRGGGGLINLFYPSSPLPQLQDSLGGRIIYTQILGSFFDD